MNPQLQLLHDRVAEAVQDTPYTVEPADEGFDVRLDLANARWRTVLGQAKLSRSVTHEVRPKKGGYSVTDVSRSVEWVAGAPAIAGSASVSRGRSIEFGAEKTWGLDERGRFIKVADYSFSSQEGRELITLAGEGLGLRQHRGTAELVGLFFAASAIGGLVIGGVVVLLLWAFGVLPT